LVAYSAGTAQSVQCLTTDWTTGIRSPAEAKDFSSSFWVQTSSETLPASYRMGTGGPFSGVKRGRSVTLNTHAPIQCRGAMCYYESDLLTSKNIVCISAKSRNIPVLCVIAVVPKKLGLMVNITFWTNFVGVEMTSCRIYHLIGEESVFVHPCQPQ
jgi:hypothetical protein